MRLQSIQRKNGIGSRAFEGRIAFFVVNNEVFINRLVESFEHFLGVKENSHIEIMVILTFENNGDVFADSLMPVAKDVRIKRIRGKNPVGVNFFKLPVPEIQRIPLARHKHVKHRVGLSTRSFFQHELIFFGVEYDIIDEKMGIGYPVLDIFNDLGKVGITRFALQLLYSIAVIEQIHLLLYDFEMLLVVFHRVVQHERVILHDLVAYSAFGHGESVIDQGNEKYDNAQKSRYQS
jgi:hypothetical protein